MNLEDKPLCNLLLFLYNETQDVQQEEANTNISLNPNDDDYDK